MFGRLRPLERLAWASLSLLLLVSLVTISSAKAQVEAAVRGERAAKDAAAHLANDPGKATETEPSPPEAAPPGREAGSVAEGAPKDVQRLFEDLQNHAELIPYPGVLGGQMGFSDPKGVRVVGPQWVLASFEDGHISGKAPLKYQIDRSGRITWKRLDSALDE